MNADFYDYQGENNVIVKTLDNTNKIGSVATITPYQPLSDLTGTITLTYNQTIFRSNYCILNFGTAQTPYTKNYFVIDRQMIQGGKMILTLLCDVLTTFQSGVLDMQVLCRRTALQHIQSPYILDENAPVETRRNVRQQEVATDFAAYSNNMILITVG